MERRGGGGGKLIASCGKECHKNETFIIEKGEIMSIKIGDEVRVVDWGFAYHSDIALICRFRGGNPFPYIKESMNPSINYTFRRFTDEKKYYVDVIAERVTFLSSKKPDEAE